MRVLDAIPSIVLDKSVGAEKDLFDAWREIVRDCYDVNPNQDVIAPSEKLKEWLVDSLIFSDVCISSQSFSRHHDHHKTASDYLSLQIYTKGERRGIVNEESSSMKPGEAHIFDFSREFHSFSGNSDVVGVVIPHDAIGYDPGRHPAYFRAYEWISSKLFVTYRVWLPRFRGARFESKKISLSSEDKVVGAQNAATILALKPLAIAPSPYWPS
ncbi:hypothetical protein K1W69_26030 [Hoeflea sp. WL0058]|uniref:Transcription regulator HTH AraC- type ligand binding domain-containing protein n=1 Tax=Flavimaribacter sediminis TaxID=2865987 RepID=A0AAE2ZUK9_9HYPH|nr:hypothetical protein [Flavimaribacter sediminis]